MITNALLNAQIDGSIFSGNVRLFDRTLTVNNYNTTYAFLVIPGSHIKSLESKEQDETDEHLPEQSDETPQITHQTASSNWSTDTDPNAPSRAAPFSIVTMLRFADPAICQFEKIDIGDIPLFVIKRNATRIELSPQPEFMVFRRNKQCNLMPFKSWELKTRRFSHQMPTEFPLGKATSMPNAVLKSQLWWGRDRSVSLYKLPRNKRLVITGQMVMFLSTVFDSIYCVLIRKHERRDVFVRKVALIALPST